MTHGENSKIGLLTKFSLDRRVSVLVLFMTIVVVGTIAAVGIPLELFPRGFTEKFLSVEVPWSDAPTREVLEKVTYPLEEELSTVRGLSTSWSYSRKGFARVGLNFKQGIDMAVAYREVRDRVERARLLFPDDVDRVFIRKNDASGIPIAMVGVIMDEDLPDPWRLMEKDIILPLERIDGVASAKPEGQQEKEIVIELDQEATEAAGLNIYDLSEELGDDNFSMASGTVRDGGKKFLLRSVATYTSLDALKNRPITDKIRLGDIADVRYEEPEQRFFVRVNGKPATAIEIMKEGEANTVATCKKITEAIAEISQNPRLKGFVVEPLFNQGDLVLESLGTLVDSGKIGGIFAALVLFLFLRRFRLTAIITFSIPLSLFIALGVMYFMGETLNLLTLLGLFVCVGLLVDNSVVVAENIHRLYQNGMGRRQACIRGASEIALAVIMATLTTVVVFLPVALVEGEGQFFLMRLAMPITVSLTASLFIALVFVPLCVYITMDERKVVEKATLFSRFHDRLHQVLRFFYERCFERLNHFYGRLLQFFLKHRLDLVIVILVMLGVTLKITEDNLELVGRQEEDANGFNIRVDMDRELNLEDGEAWFAEAENRIKARADEFDLKFYLLVYWRGGGKIEGFFNDPRTNDMTVKKATEEILALLPEKAGLEVYTRGENRNSDKDEAETFVVRLVGEDYQELDNVAEDLKPILAKVDGVVGFRRSGETAPSEMGLVVDRERAQASGVNPQAVAGVVGYALRGSSLPRFNDNGKQVPVRIRYRKEDTERLSDLENFQVPTNTGDSLPLSALTTTTMLQTAKGVFRRDKKVTRIITLDLSEEKSTSARKELRAMVARLDLPEGVSLGRPRVTVDDEVRNMGMALLFSILFIYLLMGFLFESFMLPLSILITIPLAIIGVGWAHFIMDKNLDILGFVGGVLLVGVVVNNGIVLIDYVNRLRMDGMDRTKALLQAADRRFRPILMTALTTIVGMVPLTVSKPLSLGISYKSFGLTLIGGMTTATVLTLLVVPVFYSIFDDLREMFMNALRWGMKRKDDVQAAPVALSDVSQGLEQ